MDEALSAVHADDIDASGVEALFRDLALQTQVLEVRAKGPAARYASKLEVDLEGARQAFAEGRVHALQIRYVFEGAVWCDTVMRRPTGARVVRMREQAP